ncbi:lipopolysaccharide biosynthesis protein [Marinobacter sp.]|uniref:lipopolysaccharide biosynthesis protein n=1 Tax=Marinobacter sp. TaxID=50741 RepID=UPI0034A158A0
MLSRIIKKIGALSSGSLISVLINAASYPIITQIYAPSDYGEYSMLIFYSAIFASSSLLKLDLIIPTLTDVSKARQYSFVALVNIALVSVVGGSLSIIFLELSLSKLNLFLLVVLCVSSFGIFTLVGSIILFHGQALKFGFLIAVQALLALAMQITLGVIGFDWHGLVLGYIFSFFISSFLIFLVFCPKDIITTKKETSPMGYWTVMRIEKQKWQPNVIQSVLNAVSLNVMIVGVDHIGGKESAGLFAFCQKLLVIPVRLVGNSAKQVLLRELSLSSYKQALNVAKNLTFFLGILSLAVFSGINLISGFLIEIGLGPEWVGVEDFVLPISIWLAFTVFYVPSVSLLNVTGIPKYHMCYEAVNLTSRFLFIFVSIAFGLSEIEFVYITSVLNAFLCIFLILITFYISSGDKI